MPCGRSCCHAYNLSLNNSWRNFFSDPSSWCDNRRTKNGTTLADFIHQITQESLWINGCCNPCWVYQELRRRSILEPLNGDFLERGMICDESIHKEDFIVVALLKDCAKRKDIHEGSRLHSDILRNGLLKNNPCLPSTLINMYAKCGELAKAQQVIEELPKRDVFSWSALIAGYAQHGRSHEAMSCFQRMQTEDISPNAFTFSCMLKVMGGIRDIENGKQFHIEIVIRGLMKDDVVLGNALVDMYAKSGYLVDAYYVLQELPIRNAISWSSLIAGYVQQRHFHRAVNCYEQMRGEGISPDAVTFISVLKACGGTGAVARGEEIHEEIVDWGFLKKDIMLGTALVDMYAKCGALLKAHEVLKGLPDRNVVTWNTLITGCSQHGQFCDALIFFEEMKLEHLTPDIVTFICVLKACGGIRAIDKGREIHNEIVSRGLLHKDIVLGNSLVDMYVKFSLLAKARQVLEELPERDVASWNALLSGYAQEDHGHEALECFELMRSDGITPNAVTFVCILKACGNTGAIDEGIQIHEELLKSGLWMTDIMVGNALVDMYVRCGFPAKAKKVLQELPVHDVVSWNALISGYCLKGQDQEALNCFKEMMNDGISPDIVTYICILRACGNSGAIDRGTQIHEEIINNGLLREDVAIGTALVDMYAKCGMLTKAQDVLKELPNRNVVSWSALIAGYAQHGESVEALNCFERMQKDGITPNAVTFLSVFSACGHAGLLDEAQSLFQSMTTEYGITPNIEHHTCMVVVFASAGHFDKAMSVINAMPCYDNVEVWLAFLGGCRRWGNVKLGRLAFHQIVQIDNSCASAYILVANIFAAAGMQEDAEKIEAMKLKYTSSKRQIKCNLVDYSGNLHAFFTVNSTDPQSNEDVVQRMYKEGSSGDDTLKDDKNDAFLVKNYTIFSSCRLQPQKEKRQQHGNRVIRTSSSRCWHSHIDCHLS